MKQFLQHAFPVCVQSTNQSNSQSKQPGVDEKVVPTNLDDVQKQRGDR